MRSLCTGSDEAPGEEAFHEDADLRRWGLASWDTSLRLEAGAAGLRGGLGVCRTGSDAASHDGAPLL